MEQTTKTRKAFGRCEVMDISIKLIAILVIVLSIAIAGSFDYETEVSDAHSSLCEWDDCEGLLDCEDGTDGSLIYEIHLEHPTWSYERCQDTLFSLNLNNN
jgi:hypothetical protein